MIGYRLCKNSRIPSPSFSSVAYADDVTPEKPGAKKTELVFQQLVTSNLLLDFRRAKVTGGWILTVGLMNTGRVNGLTFYPDPKHEWDGGSME
jgi:hypothetical protein